MGFGTRRDGSVVEVIRRFSHDGRGSPTGRHGHPRRRATASEKGPVFAVRLQGGPWPKRTSSGSRAATFRAESRLRAGSTVKNGGGSVRPGVLVIPFLPASTSPIIRIRS